MTSTQKAEFLVLAELNVEIHPKLAAISSYCLRRVRYRDRVVIEVSFHALDCYFVPGGNIEVNSKRYPQGIIVMRGEQVLLIKTIFPDGSDTIIENRHLCPSCSKVSLAVSAVEEIEGGKRQKYNLTCKEAGCDGASSFL